jgi:hypothetical protein
MPKLDPNIHNCNCRCRRFGCPLLTGAARAEATRKRRQERTVRRAIAVANAGSASILLLYHDQAESSRPRRETTLENARLLKLLRAGRFESHGKIFRLDQKAPAPEMPRFTCSDDPESSASISLQEMKANVGITDNTGEPGDPPLRHLVQRAQEKIGSVGRGDYTNDIKAVVISGGHICRLADQRNNDQRNNDQRNA